MPSFCTLASLRRAHLAHAAKLTQECERAQSHLAERQAEIDAHLQLQEYLTERNRRQEWEHCKAQEDVFCAQQQLEGSRKALKDAVFTMEKRIADLTARNQVTFFLVSYLGVTDASAPMDFPLSPQ